MSGREKEDPTMTTTTEPAMTLEHLDPSALIADANVRYDLRLTEEFVASIAERGVLVPLGCVRTPDGVQIRHGHRRAFAAIKAGRPTVPCIVVDAAGEGLAGDVDRILTQYDENTHREGLTTAENAGVVADLLDLGLTTEFIAKQTQMSRSDVQAAQKVAHSKVATKAADTYGFLSLDQAAGLAEFEDDEAALQELTMYAHNQPGSFAHALQRRRDARENSKLIAAARAEWEADGIKVLDQRPNYGHDLNALVDAKGKTLTEKNHRNCPGHALYPAIQYVRATAADQDGADPDHDAISDRGSRPVVRPEAYCTNPRANGHKPKYGSTSDTGAAAGKPTAEERREVIDNNKAWRSAETVRRAWLREYLTRKAIPAGALRYVLEELAHGTVQLTAAMSSYSGSHALARELLGIPECEERHYGDPSEVLKAILGASAGRAQVIALGIVLGAYESATDVQTWREPEKPWAQRYFKFLASIGYGLSDVEQLVIKTAKKP